MSPRDTMIVDAPCGPVQGICRPTSHPGSDSWAFYGLPFAQPPTGPLRFLAPRRRSPWEQPIDATRPGATAQRHALLDVTTIPEPSIAGDDTLLVNVFTPHPGRTDARAPVMVWIHGGGYVAGSPSSPWYDGNAFNRDGIVTVSVSYRLGFDGFGWVDGSDAPTNRALLDLIMALTWVRDNIASFGGDPDNVTVAGHSAGAACIHALMASGQAEGLFHAAICQSPLPITLTVDDSHVTAVHMALAAGIPATLDGWCSLSEETIYSAQQHLIIALGETAQMQVDADGCDPLTIECPQRSPFGPVIGDPVLPDHPAAIARTPGHASVPLLIGSTAHEFAGENDTGTNPATTEQAAAIASALQTCGWTADDARRFVARWSALRDPRQILNQAISTEPLVHAPLRRCLQSRDEGGAATWRYCFQWPWPRQLSQHCFDLPFSFDVHHNPEAQTALVRFPTDIEPPQSALTTLHNSFDAPVYDGELDEDSLSMHEDWVYFIRHHSAPWPRWDPHSAQVRLYF